MSDENKKIKYFRECYEAENARRRNVEQKASIYIGTLGVVGTILANGLIRLVQDTNTMPAFITLRIVYCCHHRVHDVLLLSCHWCRLEEEPLLYRPT